MATKSRKSARGSMTAAEMRAELSRLGPRAVSTLETILADEKTPARLKVDISQYVIDSVLDDPSVLQEQGNTLTKLAEILRHPGQRPPLSSPGDRDPDIV